MENPKNKAFGAYIDRTLRMIRLDLGKRFKDIGVDITPEQWVILSDLYKENGQTQTELGNRSFKNAPTVSRIINLLCKKGFTERHNLKDDGRHRMIYLTERGKETVEKAYPAIMDAREKGWQHLTEEDYNHLIRILNTIFENLGDE